MYIWQENRSKPGREKKEEHGSAKYGIYLYINAFMKPSSTYNDYILIKYLKMDGNGETR